MDYIKKLKALAIGRGKIPFTYYESHVYDQTKKENKSGFIENMIWLIDNGKSLSQKQIAVINDMYEKYIARKESEDTAEVQTIFADKTIKVEANGGFIKINDEAIDPPVDRKDAPIIAKWLFEAWHILGEIFRSLDDSATDFPTPETKKENGPEEDPF